MRSTEPSAYDWAVVGNDIQMVMNRIRKQLGEPEIQLLDINKFSDKEPPNMEILEKDLQAWERSCPGAADKLRQMAAKQLEHRLRLERLNQYSMNTIFWVIGLTTLAFIIIILRALWNA
jgi:predicted O-linked N-acetylglucosamine transferase (SPINDLY family)